MEIETERSSSNAVALEQPCSLPSPVCNQSQRKNLSGLGVVYSPSLDLSLGEDLVAVGDASLDILLDVGDHAFVNVFSLRHDELVLFCCVFSRNGNGRNVRMKRKRVEEKPEGGNVKGGLEERREEERREVREGGSDGKMRMRMGRRDGWDCAKEKRKRSKRNRRNNLFFFVIFKFCVKEVGPECECDFFGF